MKKEMSFEEMRDALKKHPRVLSSLTPLSQMVVKEMFKEDLGNEEAKGG